MQTMGLTKMQRNCLEYIQACWQENGVPPSFQEMMEHLGLHSKSGVHRLVSALEERGAIVRIRNRARAMRPVDDGGIFLMLPAEIDERLRLIAAALNVTPAQYVIELLRNRFALPDRSKYQQSHARAGG